MTRCACFVVLMACAVLPSCATPEAHDAPLDRAVRVTEVRPAEVPRGARYAVTVQPATELSLAVKASGYVAALHRVRGDDGRLRTLQPGDVVRAGTLLVRVREAEYRERLHEASAREREADAGATRARLELERARVLFDAESLTKPELDAAQAGFDGAAARLAAAHAQVATARLTLADCVLVAPIDAVVLERPLEVGMLAGVGTVAVTLGAVQDVKAVFGVPDAVVARLAPGQRLAMTSEALPGWSVDGRITGIAPSADAESRVFAVELTLPNRDGRLRPGMVGAVELAPAAPVAPAGVAVPLGAIVRPPGGDGYGVFVVEPDADGDTVRARDVTLGAAVGNAVVVTGGLRPGEQVVTMGASLVTDGERVRVIP